MSLVKLLMAVALAYGLFQILLARTPLWEWLVQHAATVRTVLAGLCWLVLGLSFAMGVYAAVAEHVFSHDEAGVLAVAANYAHGGAMYPARDGPAEYGLLYGPATYLVYLPPVLLRAGSMAWYHAWVLLALLAAHLLVYAAARRTIGTLRGGSAGRLEGLVATAVFAMLLSRSLTNEWWIKADAWILLGSAAGLWAAATLSRWPASAGMATAGALLINLKFPLLLLALLPCALLWRLDRRNRVPAAVAAAAIPLLGLLPFAMPGISLANYLQLLREAGEHGYSLVVFNTNLPTFVLLLLLPAAMLPVAWRVDRQGTLSWARRQAPFLCLFGAAVPLAVLMGAKNGGGPWHALVLTAPIVLICAQLWRLIAEAGGGVTVGATVRAASMAPVLALGTVLFATTPRAIVEEAKNCEPLDASPRAIQSELRQIIEDHRGTSLQMGYTDGAHLDVTFARPLLQVAGDPLFLDPVARNEATVTDRPISPAVYETLNRCVYPLWILPRQGAPFSLQSFYYLGHAIDRPEMYPAQFRQAFERHYMRLPGSYRYFDLWGCRS